MRRLSGRERGVGGHLRPPRMWSTDLLGDPPARGQPTALCYPPAPTPGEGGGGGQTRL